MTDMTTETLPPEGKSMTKRLAQLAGGAVVGAVGMAATLHLIEGSAIEELGAPEMISVGAGVVFILIALIVLLGAAFPKAGQHVLEVEDEADLRYQRGQLLRAGPIMVLMGAIPILVALGGPDGIIDSTAALWGVIALTIVAVVGSIAVRMKRDELNEAIAKEAGTNSFYAILLIFGGWSAAAHLGFAADIPMVLFVGACLWIWIVMIFIAAFRRGIG
ncbi:hypothetical protein [Sphingomicrobium arenosum]|uniref:hypothetical protein n=1 Tax=Sphingomicrobium arenosum TaxID=2233861 RepID=UPI00223FAE62|nr:hypothetical protein [Sphingomicrobium arenosum]